jgi:hypothetical protein
VRKRLQPFVGTLFQVLGAQGNSIAQPNKTPTRKANKKAPGLGAFLIEVIGRCGQSA